MRTDDSECFHNFGVVPLLWIRLESGSLSDACVLVVFSAFVDCSVNLGVEEKLVACRVCVCVLHGAVCSPREAQCVAVLVSGCFSS